MKSKSPNKRSKVAGALAAAIGAVGLSGRADAQNAEDFVAASAIDGVSNARQLPDGSVELTLEDGQIVRIPADQVTVRDGQVLISAEFAEGLAADANGFIQDNGLLIGAAAVVAAGVGIGVAVSGGGNDDDEVIEVAPPVNVATAGDDSLTGTDLSDTIDGLAGDDTISGLGGDDTLDGGAGSDTLLGGEGNDTLITDGADQLDGGAGIDTADFSSLGEGVIVDLDVETAGANQTNGGVDGPSQNGAILDAPPAAGGQPVNGINVVDVENIVGTEFNDGLFGNNEVNVLDGGAGDDLVHGFAGDDFLQGGEGTDTVLFAAAPAGVTVDLNDQVDAAGFEAAVAAGEGTTAATGGAGNNVLSGFENVTGSQSDDVLTGDANDNVLVGNGGDDVLVGGAGSDTLTGGDGDDVLAGGGGTDIIDGGDGVDTNSFEGIGLGVTASLEDGTASYGAINETFENIENLTGSSNDDSLTGDANDNVLGGADGNDTLVGGLGNDTLIGGEGNDTADFSDIDVPVTITVDGAGNGTATRDTGFTVSVVDAVVDGGAFGADLTPETFVSEAVAGNIYFNIHTSEFTGGEIRGQLAVDSDVTDAAGVRTITLSADLDGAQEPDNASDSEATGTASVVITVAADGTVTYSSELEVTGLAPSELISLGAVSAIHLHNAPAGVNGPVVQDFLVDAGNPSGPALPFSVAEPVSETDTLESIETFILSDDADSFISAGGGAQTVFAGEGDDFVQAGGGSDITDGGEGIDTVSFADIGSDVTVDLSATEDQAQYLAPSGATVIDQVTNFENVVGSANNDTITGDANDNALFGGAGSDTLTGGAGDDILAGGGGTDIIDGGEGVDTNSFEGIGLGVTATLNADGTGTAQYGAINESFVNIENLTGSSNNDVLIATGAAANVINGGDGDDIIAGGGGTDILDGGAGNDTNSFQGIGFDVVASLEDGTASYGPVNETFTNFENLTGSDNNDTLTGDSGVNILDGAHGDDTLSGGAGDDTLIGGNGNDTALFADLSSDISVVDNGDGSLTVTTLTEGTDTLTGVETLLDGNGDVIFTTLSSPSSSAPTQDAGLGNFVDASGIAGSEDFAANDLPDLGPLSDDAGLI